MSSLPDTYDASFKKISCLAFQTFVNHEVVFYSDSVPKGLVHFGLIDSVSSLCGGGEVSYNFLHLTLQEFLAAYYISQLPNESEDFLCIGWSSKWNTVLRFLSGLTRFQYFKQNLGYSRKPFFTANGEVSMALIHCLYEAQIEIDYKLLFGRHNFKLLNERFANSPLCNYALGYCIAKSSSATSWEVCLYGDSAEAFMWGLKSCQHGHGCISCLTLSYVHPTFLDSFPTAVLQGVKQLTISKYSARPNAIDKPMVTAIPLMKQLSSLSLHLQFYSELTLELLNKLPDTNVTTLELNSIADASSYLQHSGFLTSLTNLINPTSGNLKILSVFTELKFDAHCTIGLCGVLFQASSLNSLSISSGLLCSPNWFDLLKTNTCLSAMHITNSHFVDPIQTSLPMLTEILHVNKTILFLSWIIEEELDEECTRDFNAALHSNTTLKKLRLCSKKCFKFYSYNTLCLHSRLILDSI